jgi:membrane associated rhomboid family serine protease
MTPWVTRLLAANVLVFFVEQTSFANWINYLVFVPRYALIHPWTLVTYMFVHDPSGLSHILFNMLGLYFFGPPVEARLGSRRFITLYLISGVTGALLSFFFSPNAAVVGASGAIYGIGMAFAMFWPHERIMIWGIVPVEARLLVIIMTIITLFNGFGSLRGRGGGGGIAHFAHLGGYVGAFLYLRWIDKHQGAKKFRTKVTAQVAPDKLQNWNRVDPAKVHEVNRDEVNRILDKISKSGVGSLTAQEKLFLSNFVPPDDRVPPVS